MERYERELDAVEKKILNGTDEECLKRINLIRGDVRELRINYEQLTDLGQELEENENDFFKEDNLRYFHLFLNRMARLYDVAGSLRDYTVQLNDLYKSQIDMKQNKIMWTVGLSGSVLTMMPSGSERMNSLMLLF